MITAVSDYFTPAGQTASARIQLYAGGDDADPNFFVCFKQASAQASATYDNWLFKAVASPEDMIRLTAEERYPGYFRTSGISLYGPDAATLTPIVSDIVADVSKAVTAFRLYTEYTGASAFSAACTGTPVFGDIT